MAADPTTAQTVDALLNDDEFDSDDPFGDRSAKPLARDDKPTLSPRKRKIDDLFGNLDEEVKIQKPRKKVPKLDADRLLSDPGLPKVRALIRSGKLKEKLRLRGKGHEFNDVAKLLNYYQMWLDQLYPRAKFADAIQMVEKAGHTKRLQIYRKTWIDEGKPGYVSREAADKAVEDEGRPGDESGLPEEDATVREHVNDEDPDSMFFGNDQQTEAIDDGPDDDELEALMAQETQAPTRQRQPMSRVEESEGEDDLDALLREQDNIRKQRSQATEDQDELDALLGREKQDELDAMLEAELATSMRSPSTADQRAPPTTDRPVDGTSKEKPLAPQTYISKAPVNNLDTVFEDDSDDVHSSEQQKPTTEPELPPPPPSSKFPPSTSNANLYNVNSEEVPELDVGISSSPIPNVQTDELDDLMDEHDALMKQKNAEAGILDNAATNSM